MTRCKNCDTPLDTNFCPQCGQKNIDLERPLPEILGEVVRETIDVDGRATRTLWTLIRRPGVLTSEFLSGRRRIYSPPLRLYLVISVLFFVLTVWVAEKGILLGEDQTLEADAVGQARLFADYVPRLMFILLPVALLLKAAFRQRLYFHHLIHSLHLHSACVYRPRLDIATGAGREPACAGNGHSGCIVRLPAREFRRISPSRLSCWLARSRC